MFTPTDVKIRWRSRVFFISVLELDIKLPTLPGFRKIDAVNMQPQCPWQLSDRRSSPRSVCNFGRRFKGVIKFGDRWAFLRSLTPAVLKEFPNQIIKHARRPRRNSLHPSLNHGAGIVTLPLGRYPSQNLGSRREICRSGRMIQVSRASPRRRPWLFHTRRSSHSHCPLPGVLSKGSQLLVGKGVGAEYISAGASGF